MQFNNQETATFAYDLAPDSARAVQQAIDLNNLDASLCLREHCRHNDFDLAKNGKTLVICDIEGAEKELLDPNAAPGLRGCDIVVEVHDGPDSHEIRALLQGRFRSSHEIALRKATPRLPKNLGTLRWMMPHDLGLDVMNEGRTFGIEWLVLKAKANMAY